MRDLQSPSSCGLDFNGPSKDSMSQSSGGAHTQHLPDRPLRLIGRFA
jgi:hypothetical protein